MKHNGFYYYKVDVMGKNGYSFMAKSKDEFDECEVIDILLEKNGFNDDEDARYAVVDDLVSVSDINHFEECDCVRVI